MLKKILALILCLVTVFSFISCDSADTDKDDNKEDIIQEMNGNPVLKTDNFTITVSMMSYYINSIYHKFVDNNADSLEEMGLDTTIALEYQKYSEEYTWLDFFLFEAADTTKERILLAEAAKSEGYELTKEDKEAIDTELNNIRISAVNSGKKVDELIASVYGANVNQDTVRKCLELEKFATYYSDKLLASYSYTNDDIEAFFKDHKNDILSFSYIRYRIGKEYAEAAKTDFDACTSAEEFNAVIKKYESMLTYGITEEELNEKVEASYVIGAAYSETSDFAKWAYSDGRKANEVYTTILENGNLFAAIALPAADEAYNEVLYRDTIPVHNVKSILFKSEQYGNPTKAKNEADKVLESVNNGEMTFDEALEEYKGGITSNITPASLTEKLSDWIFDESRAEGDIGTVVIKDLGTYLIQLQADGMMSWKFFAVSMMRDESYKNSIKELYETKTLATFNDALRQISTVTIENEN